MSIRRHTIYNLFGSVIPLVIALVTIPIYLDLIGEARYGVLAIAWLLLGYFGLFDLGLGRATAQRIAALRDGTPAQRAEVFWTALSLNIGLGVIGGLLIWPVAYYFFGHVFNVGDALRPEILAAVPWLILAVPVATLSGVLSGALQGRERFWELNLVSVIGAALSQLLPLAAAKFLGASLGILMLAAVFSRVFTLLVLSARCRRHVVLGYDPSFSRAQARHLFNFGGWVTVTSFVGPMMVALDRFIIGAVMDAKAVTHYTVPFQLGRRSTIISKALSSALFPRLAAASPQEGLDLALEGLRTILVVMTSLVVVGLLLIGPFLSWWVTPAFAKHSTQVGQILLLGFWVNSLAIIPYAQLQARGRPDLVAKCHVGEVLPYFGLLYLGLGTLGIAGAALAFSIRVMADFVLLAGLSGTLRPVLRYLWPPIVLLAAATWLATQSKVSDPLWLALIILELIVTVTWAWWQAPVSFKRMMFLRRKSLTLV